MPYPSTGDILNTLRTTNLLTRAQWNVLSAELHLISGETQRLVNVLVERKWLSLFQAELVLTDRARDLEVGPYVLWGPIGAGNLGEVYKARHAVLRRRVALKVIPRRNLTDSASAVTPFLREARAAAKTAHPNIVTVYESGCCNDQYFVAMEHLKGMDLATMVQQHGPLPVDVACEFVRQACLGLQHAHEHRLVHRDIKPSNLFAVQAQNAEQPETPQPMDNIGASPTIFAEEKATLDHTPFLGNGWSGAWRPGQTVIKILDLGLVPMSKMANAASSALTLTEAGPASGTLDYIAPEQALDSHLVDIRADLYSLGCTFYHLLAGRPPFPTGNAVEKLQMHMVERRPKLQKIRPELDPVVARLVRKLMAKAPMDRFQTPGEVALLLADILNRAPAPVRGGAPQMITGSSRPAVENRPRKDTPAPNASSQRLSAPPLPFQPGEPVLEESRGEPTTPRTHRLGHWIGGLRNWFRLSSEVRVDAERRATERFPFGTAHPHLRPSIAPLDWPTRVTDISLTGIGFFAGMRQEPNTIIKLSLVDDTRRLRWDVRVTVRRVERCANGYWHVGCLFEQPLGQHQLEQLL